MNPLRTSLASSVGILLVLVLASCSTEGDWSSEGPDRASATYQAGLDTSVPDDWADLFGGESIESVVEAQRTEWLKTTRSFLPEDLPEVPLERIVSLREFEPLMVECLADEGFSVRAAGDGGILFDEVPIEQEGAKRMADAVCSLRYWPNPYETASKTPREPAKALYDYLVDTAAPCIQGRGIAVSEPPSKEAWVEAAARGQDAWSPYDSFTSGNPSPERWAELLDACPQVPEGFYPAAE